MTSTTTNDDSTVNRANHSGATSRHSNAHWHGFTQMSGYEPLVISSADGCDLFTEDGQKLFDGCSSLWCNVHGHRHPALDSAVRHQLDRAAHITTLGMCSDVTMTLAEKIAEITPGDLGHTFFSSDGSSAVEAAIKMAFQYWQQRPDPRPRKTQYLALGSAYHGDTTGSVSLGGIDYFHKLFGPILFSPIRGPVPCSYRLPEGVEHTDALDCYATELENLIARHAETLAAVVMEPLVQGAAGMVTHPVGLLRRVRQACDAHDVLLICDEVAVGFGRTGRLFACEHEDVTPDIMVMGKGLTGGYLPLAATVARPHIFDAFLAQPHEAKQFYHGHTFGGNPIACAVALASIKLFDEPDYFHEICRKADLLRSHLSPLACHANVGDIRGRGLMVGIEIVTDQASRAKFDAKRQVGARICDEAVRRGLWIRPLGDTIILMPPLVADDEQLRRLADVASEAIETVLKQP